MSDVAIPPMSASNITDSDGDGVSDLLTFARMMQRSWVELIGEVVSIGLGEAIDRRGQTAGVSYRDKSSNFMNNLLTLFGEVASEAVQMTRWGVDNDTGTLVKFSDFINTFLGAFIAETATSPDGECFYLLAVIIFNTPQLDQILLYLPR